MIGIAMIGAGAIVRRGHLLALSQWPDVAVTLVDLDPALLLQVQREFGIDQVATDCAQVFADPGIEVVAICTPTQTHTSLILQALRAGKHVLVEKPMTLDLAGAVEVYHAAQASHSTVGIVQNYRYFAAVQQMRRRLVEGFIGHPISMQGVALTKFPNGWTRSRWPYHKRGALSDFAPHLLDLIRWMNDSPLRSVAAYGGDYSGGRMGFVTHAQALLEFADGTTAGVDISWLTGTIRFELQVHGTGGHLALDVRGNTLHETHGLVTPLDDAAWFLARARSTARGLLSGEYFAGGLAFYETVWRQFLQAAKSGAAPAVTIEDGLWVCAVTDAILAALRVRRVIEMPDFLIEAGLSAGEARKVLEPPARFNSTAVLAARPKHEALCSR